MTIFTLITDLPCLSNHPFCWWALSGMPGPGDRECLVAFAPGGILKHVCAGLESTLERSCVSALNGLAISLPRADETPGPPRTVPARR